MKRTFDEIIDINEQIKQVDALSRQVNLEAINASLSARTVGDLGRGFAVVARELQRFSQTLDRFRDEQNRLNSELITLTARRMGVEARTRQLHRALEFDAARGFMAEISASADRELEQFGTQMALHNEKMCHLVRRMSAYCRSGQAISKNAMVEAAHCGLAGAELRKVADAMEEAITRITACLATIGRMNAVCDGGRERGAA